MRFRPVARTLFAGFVLAAFSGLSGQLGSQMGLLGAGGEAAFAADEKRKQTRRVPTMSESTYKKLAEAQELIDAEDYVGALNTLDGMLNRSRRYNGNELGAIHNMMAFVHYNMERYDLAIEAYELVIAQGDQITEGLETTVIYSLAQLHYTEENFNEALRYMRLWLSQAQNPSPEPHIFMAQVYYRMNDYPEAIVQVETAIGIAQERGTEVKETWWGLLKYLYFEQDNWAKVIDILEILVRDFSKRDYWVQLAQVYGQEGHEDKQVYTYEAAHALGFLDRETDMRNYAGLLMQSTVPYRASKWLQQAIDDGIVEDTSKNLQSLGQAYQLAQDVDEAIEVFEKAGTKSDDGEIYARLAMLYLEKDEHGKCTEAADSALTKGGLRKPYSTEVIQGMCLFNRDRLTQARRTFVEARTGARVAKDRAVERMCSRWIAHIDNEKKRRDALAAAD
ncbi:MAG: hypothetical protein OXH52_10960 [Gammaproteobacteria bacterium]|nr:hypothetical protein [Gammaproteobacteria bacterium]